MWAKGMLEICFLLFFLRNFVVHYLLCAPFITTHKVPFQVLNHQTNHICMIIRRKLWDRNYMLTHHHHYRWLSLLVKLDLFSALFSVLRIFLCSIWSSIWATVGSRNYMLIHHHHRWLSLLIKLNLFSALFSVLRIFSSSISPSIWATVGSRLSCWNSCS